jgi:gamma-glutamyl-gamma-aminobutyrate hydrolase PuuD
MKQQRLKIGLTYTGSDKKHDNYARWIQGGDESIAVVRIEAGGSGGSDWAGGNDVGDLDGLVLSGGVDIAPEFYSGDNAYAHAPDTWERARDLFELGALERALARRIPVFGVCRGLQLINVALGGSLVQDLGEAGDAVHEGAGGIDKQHGVWVERGSLLGSIVEGMDAGSGSIVGEVDAGSGSIVEGMNAGSASIVGMDTGSASNGDRSTGGGFAAGAAAGIGIPGLVNSAHHQAIARLAEGLRVNCRAEDGTIEGVEWAEPEGRSFLLAVQWHPERMYVNGVGDIRLYRNIRDRFIAEVMKRGH